MKKTRKSQNFSVTMSKRKKVDNLKIELHFLCTNHAILFYISHDVNEKGANGKLSLKKK